MKIKARLLFEPQFICFGFSWHRIYAGKGLILWIHPLPAITLEVRIEPQGNQRDKFKNSVVKIY